MIELSDDNFEGDFKYTAGRVNLQIIDINYDSSHIYVDKINMEQTIGDRLILTFKILSGHDLNKTFKLFYNLGHPDWGVYSKRSYAILANTVFPNRVEAIERAKDPNNLLDKLFSAYLYSSDGSTFVRLKQYSCFSPSLSSVSPSDARNSIDEDIPF